MKIFDNIAQGSDEWFKLRAWVITGTRLKQVMSSRKDTRQGLIYELIGEKIVPPRETYVSGIMERWHIVEQALKDSYHEPIESVWFIKKNDWLGISPDGIQRDENSDIKRAFEIKAPEIKNSIKYWLDGNIPDEYYWQVIHYFIVIDTLESLDFLIVNPDIPDEFFRIKKITVTREELADDIAKAENALAEFYGEWTATMNTLLSLKK